MEADQNFEIENLVIGAGISGLLIARRLHDAGRRVVVLDKGRGVGGRMATRRQGQARFDHGAQYFTVRSEAFKKWADDWLAAGVIKEWFRKLPGDRSPDGYPRYIGLRGISDIPKYLAEGLTLRKEQRVCRLSFNGSWRVETDSGLSFQCRRLILTPPVPQALELLRTADVDLGNIGESLAKIRYRKGLAVMATLDGPSGLPDFGGLKITSGPLEWIADNQRKGISPEVAAVTLHACADYAEAYWDEPDEIRAPPLIAAASPMLKAAVREIACHRWGFTRPVSWFEDPFFYRADLNLMLAGDGFGGPRVEGAALSGLAAADALLA